MDWTLIIFILVVALFAWRGFRNGLYKSIGRVASLAAGYAAAILFTGRLAPLIEAGFELSGVVALAAASLILFVGASLLVGLLFWLLGLLLIERGKPSTLSAVGGAAVGSLVGLLIAIIVVWVWAFARDLQPSSQHAASRAAPGGVELLANRVASRAVETAMNASSARPEVAGLGAALMAAPGEVAQRARRLMESDDLLILLNDPGNQRVLNSGDAEAVRQLPAFQKLVQNPDLVALADAAGLDTGDPRAMQQSIAQQLTDTWIRAQQVKNDPRVQEIIADPEFQQKLRSGNPLDLIGNDELHELANIVFDEDSAPRVPSPGESPKVEETPTKKKIYTWTDSSGRLHVSDQKPED